MELRAGRSRSEIQACRSCGLSVGQLNGIAVRVLAVAQAIDLALADLTESCTPRHQFFTLSGYVLGVEYDLRTLAAGR